MISKRTIFSLVLLLLLCFGVRGWSLEQRDDCDRFRSDAPSIAEPTQNVKMGSRTVVVPCRLWVPRQPMWVQMVCLAGLALSVVFVFSCWSDLKSGLEIRRRTGVRA